MDAFDADVLIMAAQHHPDAAGIRRRFTATPGPEAAGVGSVLLLPELLSHPLQKRNGHELATLMAYVSRLTLTPVDQPTAQLSVTLRAQYRLRTVDAIHLATAILLGASRFVTNNHKDFKGIAEVDVVGPARF